MQRVRRAKLNRPLGVYTAPLYRAPCAYADLVGTMESLSGCPHIVIDFVGRCESCLELIEKVPVLVRVPPKPETLSILRARFQDMLDRIDQIKQKRSQP